MVPFQQLLMLGTPGQRATAGLRSVEIAPLVTSLSTASPILLGSFSLLVILSGLSLLANRRRLRPGDAVLWVAFLLLALAAVRNVALFALAAAPLLVRNANEWLDAHEFRLPEAARLLPVAVASLLLLLTWDVARGSFFQRIGSPRESRGYAGRVARVGRARFYGAVGRPERSRELLRELREHPP